MRRKRPRFELRMKLYPDEPRMIGNLHDLGQPPVRRPAGYNEAMLAKLSRVPGVHFVTMPVAFTDFGTAVDFGHPAAWSQDCRVGPETHRAAEIASLFA